MTKTEYIQTKTANPIKLVYSYYKEKFNYSKHSPFLSENEFYNYLQISSDVNKTIIKVFNYYDNLYNVVTLMDKNGNIITFF
jgi:hypothetical protein